MNHIVTTIANGKILYTATVGDTLTFEEWRDISMQMTRILHNSPDKMHVIVNMTDLKNYPRNAAKLITVTKWATESNMKSLNHITTDRFIKILGDVVISMLAIKYNSENSLEVTLQKIVENDTDLNQYTVAEIKTDISTVML